MRKTILLFGSISASCSFGNADRVEDGLTVRSTFSLIKKHFPDNDFYNRTLAAATAIVDADKGRVEGFEKDAEAAKEASIGERLALLKKEEADLKESSTKSEFEIRVLIDENGLKAQGLRDELKIAAAKYSYKTYFPIGRDIHGQPCIDIGFQQAVAYASIRGSKHATSKLNGVTQLLNKYKVAVEKLETRRRELNARLRKAGEPYQEKLWDVIGQQKALKATLPYGHRPGNARNVAIKTELLKIKRIRFGG